MMRSEHIVEWLKGNLECATIDFKQMEYDCEDDAVYDEDDDKCKIGYVNGYLDALNMLINQSKSTHLVEGEQKSSTSLKSIVQRLHGLE